MTLRPVREGNRTVAIDGSARDVTRWWHVLTALRRTRRMVREGFDGVATVDATTREFLSMDAKAMALLAVEREAQVAKLSLEDFFEPDVVERFRLRAP